MTNKPSSSATELRARAEERLRERHSETGPVRTEADMQRLVNELQIHQIELEMQNEELQKTRDELEIQLENYSELYDFAPVGYVTLDPRGTILEANLTSATLLGIERSRLIKRRLTLMVAEDDRPAFNRFLTRVFKFNARECCEVLILPKDKPAIVVHVEASADPAEQICRAVIMDITERHRANAERERLIQELQTAMAQVKSLRGLLPICAGCKQIRDDKGYWQQVETYIQEHTNATFTHGLCPDCIKKYFPEIPPEP